MTQTAKLRAVYLSAIVVFSVFASVAVFGGPALAATNNSGTVSVGNAPMVSVADATIDPSTDSEIPVAINVANTGLSVSEVALQSRNDTDNSTLNFEDAQNAPFNSVADTGSVTIPAGSVGSDFTFEVTAYDNSSGTLRPIENATSTSSVTVQSGSDTTAPAISKVVLDESSGNMVISFDSDEQLGTSSSDLAASVSGPGPGGKTYTFDRTQFDETGDGPYTYSLVVSQAYDDGDGTYGLSIADAKDSAGNNGGLNGDGSGPGFTDTYDYTASGGDGTAFISGTVTDTDGNTVSSAPVFALDDQGNLAGQATTDVSGAYSIQVSAGAYDVIVDYEPNYEFEIETDVTVGSSSTEVADFQIAEYPGKGTLEGVVEDADGNSVQGVTVNARDLGYQFGGRATTNANGEFSMSVPASNYMVRTETADAPPKTLDNVTVREGETTDVGTIQFPESGYIAGTVTDASGNPQQRVGVVADGGNGILYDGTDASGNYNITVPPGEYTVSVFAKGQDAGSKSVTVSGGAANRTDFTLQKTTVVHSSVEVIDGAAGVQAGKIGVEAEVARGMLQAKLVNTSKPSEGIGGTPHELETLGVDGNTKFRINMTVTNFTASSLMWGIGDAEWNTSQNATVANGTDITVEGTPIQLQVMFGGKGGAETGVGPLINKDPSDVSWPTGRDDRAVDGRNQTVYFGVFDLSNLPASARNNLNGMSVTTNAQRFSTPSVVNQSLRVWLAAPTKTVAGEDHSGFYKAEIPQAQLDEWGVSNPESELNALYKGDQANFTVTDTDSGAQILLENISYSAGFAEVEANPSSDESSSSSSSSGGGGGGGTAVTDEQTDDGTAVTTEQTDDGTTATIERVGTDDPTVSIAVEGAAAESFAVTESSTAFEEGTDAEGTVSVSASAARPANTPSPPGDDRVLGYVSVDVEGELADDVAEGSFTVDLSGSDIDPADVTAHRYDGDEWQRVGTRAVGDASVEVTSPGGYSAFAIGTGETDEPVSTDTPATTATPTGANPEESTETATSTPATVDVGTPTRTATATSTPTPGASGPGFGAPVALLALAAALAGLRLKR
jgi:hypothetical protein